MRGGGDQARAVAGVLGGRSHRHDAAGLEGRKGEAAGAIPDDLVDDVALVGPKERIADRLQFWKEAGVDTLIAGTYQGEALQALAEVAA
jgi:alkanesulfonate monooxygenase SsuD/methylene tetrahydromethanopterin reductase-like flavin-dependent oxidoreductase (luciferase family)